MSFLPQAYEVPHSTGGRYFKPQDGENRVRILTDCIVGWLYWTGEGKPVRLKEQPQVLPPDIRLKDGQPERIKHFWVTVVYNYATSEISLWEITQVTIQGAISSLYDDADWGHPRQYDLKITRTGKDFDTKYQVIPGRPSEIPPTAIELFNETPIDLNRLYSGGDPFDTIAHSHQMTDKHPMLTDYLEWLVKAGDDAGKIKKAYEWVTPKLSNQADLDKAAAMYTAAIEGKLIPF